MRRRTVLAAASAVVLAPALRVEWVERAVADPTVQATWQLRWAPRADVDGLAAFEGVEDDRANSHPAGQPHIFVSGTNYRFNMHLVDRDSMTDRQRQEVKGMVANGANLILLKGETWRLAHSMFIPSSLKATTTFTHIMQTKAPGTNTLPMITMSLRRHDGVQKIELVVSGTTVGMVDLVPLQNRWIDVELDMTIGDAATGRVRWALRDAGTTVIDVTRTGVDTWLEDRVRPKWGIYRSLGDTSGSLQDCYQLITGMRAYQWSSTEPPPLGTRYEAENAIISQGAVESNWPGFTGTGFVNLTNVVGSYVQFAVTGPASTLQVRYANGTTADRPMSLTVNGASLGTTSFPPTGAWTTWATVTRSISLGPGDGTIRLTSAVSSGGPNLDMITLS
jgi:hypothetical protein